MMPSEQSSNLGALFYRRSPLTMDPLKGPDAQYAAGARDMLTVVVERLRNHGQVGTVPDIPPTYAEHFADILEIECGGLG